MSTKAFDARNQQDFDKITSALTEAISAISRDGTLKATVTELSRLSGVHRNTIYQRVWPVEKLTLIKEQRVIKEIANARKKEKRKDPVSVLEDKLEKSRLEVVYWFNKFRDAEQSAIALERRLTRVRDARDDYLSSADERLNKIKALEADIDKLMDVIRVLEFENTENSK